MLNCLLRSRSLDIPIRSVWPPNPAQSIHLREKWTAMVTFSVLLPSVIITWSYSCCGALSWLGSNNKNLTRTLSHCFSYQKTEIKVIKEFILRCPYFALNGIFVSNNHGPVLLYLCHRAVRFNCHWPAPGPTACRPSPCPARPAGMKAAPGGRSPWKTLCMKCGASPPPSCSDSCWDSRLACTSANFLCSFKSKCCQLEESNTVCLSVCQPALICSTLNIIYKCCYLYSILDYWWQFRIYLYDF